MVPFVDLKAQYISIKPEIDAAIQGILDTCQFTLGREVTALEEEFAAYSGSAFGCGVNSGTSALHLALLVAGVRPGDEVITVPFTFVATVSAIYYTGAKAVFVDVDPATLTMAPDALESAITPRTKAIIPVHLYGQPADMDPILAIARRYGIPVIEDAAQAHGAEYKGRRVGSLGDLGCFSFYPGKNLGAYGEGGMVLTSNPDFARSIRMLRDWGAEKKYHHVLKGYNYRLEGMQGAILRVKLRYLDAWTESRRTAATCYNELLSGCSFIVPKTRHDVRHVYHIYAIRVQKREKLQAWLQSQGIQSGIHYPTPVHLLPAFEDLGYAAGQFPNAEAASAEVLSLPMYAELTAADQQRVVESLTSFAAFDVSPAESISA
jgi:dTDP-4-amino-4,6-dideoxygalactose transaminase